MAVPTTRKPSGAGAKLRPEYWKIDVYPFEFGGEPDKRVIVLGMTSEEALSRVQRLFPKNGRLSARKVRPSARYRAIAKNSFLVEPA